MANPTTPAAPWTRCGCKPAGKWGTALWNLRNVMLEGEQALAHANRELVRRFEAKIKVTIDRVWSAA